MSERDDEALYESLRELILSETVGDPERQEEAAATSNDGADPWIGRRVGNYLVAGLMGEGGSALVYRALHLDLKRDVALKVLKTSRGTGRAVVERFRQEAMCAIRLEHPSIVTVHDMGVAGGSPWIAMELLAGPALHQWCEGVTSLRPRLQVMTRVADAVAHAHADGVVHRDLKPENVIMDGDQRPVVVDFGLARAAEDPRTTVEGVPMGTPAFMAPEQVRGQPRSVDARTDVYALGVMLFEVASGRLPFEGESREALYDAILNQPAPSLKTLVPDVSRDLEAVVTRCLEKEPDDRYDDAGALAADLERVLAGDPVAARPAGPLGRVRRWIVRHPGRVAVTVGVLMACVVAGGVVVTARQDRVRAERQRVLLERALAIERADGAVASRLRPVVNRLSVLPPGEEDRARELVAEAARLLEGVEEVEGTVEGWRSWVLFLAGDAAHREVLARARDRWPDNPLLPLFAARRDLRLYAASSSWPQTAIKLYPAAEPVTMDPAEESPSLRPVRSSAREAVSAARGTLLWGHLSRGWAQPFAAACDAYGTGDYAACREAVRPLRDIEEVTEEAHLLLTLACCRSGDFEAAAASAEALESRRPGVFANLLHRAHAARVLASLAVGRREDGGPMMERAERLFEAMAPYAEVDRDLADLALLRAFVAEQSQRDPRESLHRAVDLLDGYLEDHPESVYALLSRASARQGLVRAAQDRSSRALLLRQAGRDYRRASILRPDDPTILFFRAQVDCALLREAAREGAVVSEERWEEVNASLRRALELGLPDFEFSYMRGMAAFYRAEALGFAGGDPGRWYEEAHDGFLELVRRRPRVLELRQMLVVIRIQQLTRDPEPVGAAVLELLQDIDSLVAASSRYGFLDGFADRLLREIGGRIKEPPEELRRRLQDRRR